MKKENKLSMEKALVSLFRHKNKWTVFNDFLDFCLLMLRWWDVKEEMFSDLKKKYDRSDWQYFSAAYVAMADDAFEFKDPFGDFFMEHLSNDRAGQFFTPEHVCDLMARLTMGDIKDNQTVSDPCCGSGRNLLAAAKINRNAIFIAADVDETCCKMTVINMMLQTMKGEVHHMNTITQYHYGTWVIEKTLMKGMYVPYYYTFPGTGAHKYPDPPKVEPENFEYIKVNKTVKQQMSLF
jgi:type I restriction enzyme M protein